MHYLLSRHDVYRTIVYVHDDCVVISPDVLPEIYFPLDKTLGTFRDSTDRQHGTRTTFLCSRIMYKVTVLPETNKVILDVIEASLGTSSQHHNAFSAPRRLQSTVSGLGQPGASLKGAATSFGVCCEAEGLHRFYVRPRGRHLVWHSGVRHLGSEHYGSWFQPIVPGCSLHG